MFFANSIIKCGAVVGMILSIQTMSTAKTIAPEDTLNFIICLVWFIFTDYISTLNRSK